MFTDQYTRLHLAKVVLKTEERKQDERFPVFGVGLVLEPFTYDPPKQLGPEVDSHCFTEKRAIREQMSEVSLEIDEAEQCLIVRMAEDVGEHCRLRQVRVRRLKITKRDASGDGASRKSKKVGPQQATLRATLDCLVDSAEKTHQQFLCDFFARDMFYTFEPEQKNLFTGVHTDEDGDDEEDEPQQGLRLAGRPPAPDPDAGHVLDENTPPKAPKAKRGGKPKA